MKFVLQKSRAVAPVFLSVALFLTLLIVGYFQPSHSESVKQLKIEDEEMRRTMVKISRQLGVDCTTCHSSKNFSSAEKMEFRVAREHMKLTQLLIDNGMNGKDKAPLADCYMCHRGKLKPDYKEPFDPMIMEKEKTKVQTSEGEE